ncbi:TetR/AcrR family transcriptional regulator [Sulfitobacter sp. M57]|uniref:TetR/AcrR family transcriptional regulator n=1 Tax=unclassified Sulfitobacter TaxID=196795 RepID=UPI0023E28A4F|nr:MULTISPECIES: TetR/AcrR family transcriptional regulator [unclassified Sulfitobacter]MDF3415432.1 TetR/AcrR family transcriptional regulator [Sulfitobacter sp. KE5]MDF3422913.1 TetR/AcrR family transcriptional regulator [Sulfitobacter sp. KE43]MDF3433978.1 TetR/AcrR family transcriptional regulator [Sulfitobacter sp. KE42]MDF3459618.1 TetR/AcrR family transcriptional regulator [Sulfitobacter sp. S74]MDF3463517.1 TetR/AcrR family transcriptional regulator [Sulfitobacter sp. Ks18]
MRTEKRQARQAQIEEEAYALFDTLGFDGTSMLAVAKRAKASNETLYRWYGDKHGLFESMVQANADLVRKQLTKAAEGHADPMTRLTQVAPVLLGMLLGPRAIALNRAAASDPTGALGQLLAKGGREDVLPLIKDLLAQAIREGQLQPPQDGDIGGVFMHLLVGDRQIRRVIGTLPPPTEVEIAEITRIALAQFTALCASAKPVP